MRITQLADGAFHLLLTDAEHATLARAAELSSRGESPLQLLHDQVDGYLVNQRTRQAQMDASERARLDDALSSADRKAIAEIYNRARIAKDLAAKG
ncbi:MAG TPA: hypothetical protein VEC39_14665 [Vicinamibacterales bacterium]|nr:hypothetical protein [Vicinamibacterales bacterium]